MTVEELQQEVHSLVARGHGQKEVSVFTEDTSHDLQDIYYINNETVYFRPQGVEKWQSSTK